MHSHFLRRLRAAWHPDEFHGWGITRRYFEGWYFKMVSLDEQHALAFIPGISFEKNGESHAFIQVMDGKACQAYYFRFDSKEFQASATTFELSIGKNFFSAHSIRLDLPGFQGEIHFKNSVAWPRMLGAPGIMGWYSFVPFMECNHGVVSMNHQLEGALTCTLNPGEPPQRIVFSGGKGYLEKDWGRSFPRAYVWMQTNHFGSTDRASLLASVAHIPWLRSHFIGFISGFWLEGKLHRFATYTGAQKHLEIGASTVTLVFKNRREELRLLATQAVGTALISPLQGEMTGKINESLQATVQVELRIDGQRVFEDIGRNAGLELAGALEVLTDHSSAGTTR